jgi:hypothetical protein
MLYKPVRAITLLETNIQYAAYHKLASYFKQSQGNGSTHLILPTSASQSSEVKIRLKGTINTQFCQAPSSDSFGSEYSFQNSIKAYCDLTMVSATNLSILLAILSSYASTDRSTTSPTNISYDGMDTSINLQSL